MAASHKDGSGKPGSGTRKSAPQPTRKSFPVKTSAKTRDQRR